MNFALSVEQLSFALLVLALVAAVGLFVLVRSLKLPGSFEKNQQERRKIKLELAETDGKEAPAQDEPAKKPVDTTP
jgi:hypothetical protein